ncbi:MAG: transcription elongation factor GreA [Armatimonadetes bacterium]|nr:transcription elongation factor GreA [Armatimonadota bacterium]
MANEILLTREGFDRLKKELEDLKGPVRMKVAEAIREAKSHGDLRENAAYHEAKLNQARLDARIAELEKTLQLAKVFEKKESDGLAHIGSVVKLFDTDFDEEFIVKMVGDFESNPAEDLISINSPLGQALRGAKQGDTISVTAPGGVQNYRVISVD